jgi:hypothetical protein
MSIFNFDLMSLEKCPLSVKNGEKYAVLSTISYCNYYFSLGDVKLFEFSEAWKKKYPQYAMNFENEFFETVMSSFYEILFDMYYGMPEEIFKYIDTAEKFEKLERKRELLFHAISGTSDENDGILESLWKLFCFATLDTWFLKYKSRCAFFHVGDQMIIQYDFRDKDEDGDIVWSAGAGTYVLPFYEFEKEFENFLTRYFHEMEKRITHIEELIDSGENYVEVINQNFPPRLSHYQTLYGSLQWEKEMFFESINRYKEKNFERELQAGMQNDWNSILKALNFLDKTDLA